MRIILKIGSSTLTYNNGKPNLQQLERLTRVAADLKNAGHQPVMVSSGAIAAGFNRLGMPERPRDSIGKKASAAVGQCKLMAIYDRLFAEYGYSVAQILMTRDIIESPDRKDTFIRTFESLLTLCAVPIVNENDTVSTEDLDFGDNDHLSAVLAKLIRADLLIILTDIGGLYDSDPRKNAGAKLIETVSEITPELLAMAGGSGSALGTGGMHSKVLAAQIATSYGTEVVIMSGEESQSIYNAVGGGAVGTRFKAAHRGSQKDDIWNW